MKFPENWQLLDCGGDLYAPQTMTDADGNRISIAWLRMPEPVDGIWQGMFCLPRVVDVQNDHIYFRVLPAIRDGFCEKDGFPRFGMRRVCHDPRRIKRG